MLEVHKDSSNFTFLVNISGSQFILNHALLSDGTIIFAPLLQFELSFFVIIIADVNNRKSL